MLQRLQAMWRSWRGRRREYGVQRALYKASGHGDAQHGGFDRKGADPDKGIRGIGDPPL
jgi:hypothetical protein